jgi:hypothetical protein
VNFTAKILKKTQKASFLARKSLLYVVLVGVNGVAKALK